MLDIWALLHVAIFSLLLLSIMYLKLTLYDLRRSDIRLLQNEYYRASLAAKTRAFEAAEHADADALATPVSCATCN